MYSGPIIDAHTHLWDLAMNKHPWLSPSNGSVQALGGLEKIRRTYLVQDYLRDSANQNIVASVHVEALWDRSDPLRRDEVAGDAGQVARRRGALRRLRSIRHARGSGHPGGAGVLPARGGHPRYPQLPPDQP